MTTRIALLLPALLLPAADAQLRPRRVGTNALGEQEAVLTDVPVGGGAAAPDPGGAGLDAMQAGLEALQGMMGGEGGGLDMAALMKNMDLENNPMLKMMADANPEMAKILSDPEALKGQMEQMAQVMSSPEGKNMMGNMMQEMQNVMTDPDKLKAGLEQLSSNPALKGLADAVPGLREVLDDPAQLEEQATKAAEIFQSLADPEKAKELLGSLGGGEGGDVMENVQNMLANLGGGEGGGLEELQSAMRTLMEGGADGEGGGLGDLLGGLGGLDDEGGGGDGGDGDLKARVREQMAAMMSKRRAGVSAGIDDDEF